MILHFARTFVSESTFKDEPAFNGCPYDVKTNMHGCLQDSVSYDYERSNMTEQENYGCLFTDESDKMDVSKLQKQTSMHTSGTDAYI